MRRTVASASFSRMPMRPMPVSMTTWTATVVPVAAAMAAYWMASSSEATAGMMGDAAPCWVATTADCSAGVAGLSR
jgi:hypothetical protein